MLQTALTTAIVLAAALYATWALMPAALRRALARRLLAWAPGSRWLQAAARQSGGCAQGCGGACDAPRAPQTITLHRRRP